MVARRQAAQACAPAGKILPLPPRLSDCNGRVLRAIEGLRQEELDRAAGVGRAV
jgi:hypothetical protein